MDDRNVVGGDDRTMERNPDPFSGKIIGRGGYRLESRIGRGGMGKVYKATQLPPLCRTVAVKLLNETLDNDQLARLRFEEEAQSLSLVAHPNLIIIHEYGLDQEAGPYLVMEFVNGVSLKQILRETQGRLPLARSLDITAQIADGLAAAHDVKLLHRDLKPENIMLTRMGDRKDFVKVIDFGIAKRLRAGSEQSGQRLTMTGKLMGTAFYMAPEAVRATGRALDERADIYALGVMLYEMLSGCFPYRSPDGRELVAGEEDPMTLLVAHMMFNPVPLSERPTLQPVPELLERLVRYALTRDPDRRLPSMRLFRDRLREVLGAIHPEALVQRGEMTSVLRRSEVSIVGVTAPGVEPVHPAVPGEQPPPAPADQLAKPVRQAREAGRDSSLDVAAFSKAWNGSTSNPSPAQGVGQPSPGSGLLAPQSAQGPGQPSSSRGIPLPRAEQSAGQPSPSRGTPLPRAEQGAGQPSPSRGTPLPRPEQGPDQLRPPPELPVSSPLVADGWEPMPIGAGPASAESAGWWDQRSDPPAGAAAPAPTRSPRTSQLRFILLGGGIVFFGGIGLAVLAALWMKPPPAPPRPQEPPPPPSWTEQTPDPQLADFVVKLDVVGQTAEALHSAKEQLAVAVCERLTSQLPVHTSATSSNSVAENSWTRLQQELRGLPQPELREYQGVHQLIVEVVLRLTFTEESWTALRQRFVEQTIPSRKLAFVRTLPCQAETGYRIISAQSGDNLLVGAILLPGSQPFHDDPATMRQLLEDQFNEKAQLRVPRSGATPDKPKLSAEEQQQLCLYDPKYCLKIKAVAPETAPSREGLPGQTKPVAGQDIAPR